MKIRKINISDDGEEFDSEEACLEYENKINSKILAQVRNVTK